MSRTVIRIRELADLVIRHVVIALLSALVFIVLNGINETAFLALEQSYGINWVFCLPG